MSQSYAQESTVLSVLTTGTAPLALKYHADAPSVRPRGVATTGMLKRQSRSTTNGVSKVIRPIAGCRNDAILGTTLAVLPAGPPVPSQISGCLLLCPAVLFTMAPGLKIS